MSSDTKWTPGPWIAANGFGQDIYPEDGSDGMHHIAELCPEGFENDDCAITWEEAAANAHLIAAAPELYEALDALRAQQERMMSAGGCEGPLPNDVIESFAVANDILWRDAYATLAKARGEAAGDN